MSWSSFCIFLLFLLFSAILVSNFVQGAEESPFWKSGHIPRHFSQWTEVRDATPEDRVTVFLALKQRNLDSLSKIHASISDPRSPDYGKMYSKEEVLRLIAPPAEDVQKVIDWIQHTARSVVKRHQISAHEPKMPIVEVESLGDALKIQNAPAHIIEELFSTKLKLYRHETSGMQAVRQEFLRSYSLPQEIAPIVEMVTGLSDFPHLRKSKSKQAKSRSLEKAGKETPDQEAYDYIIPETIRSLYSIPASLQGGSNPSNIQVALEFNGVSFPYTEDWVLFDQEANEVFQNYSKIINAPSDGSATESTLDVEYLTTIGSNIASWYWTIMDGWAYEMALEIFNAPQPHPTVVSVSYGWPELDTCDSSVTMANCTGMDSQTYVNRANTELQKTGLLRISFLIASQDEGAPSEYNIDCALDGTPHPVFGIYPCSSPYVTCVSATTVGPEDNPNPTTTPPLCNQGYSCSEPATRHEVPCSVPNTEYEWTTGGGFSEFAPRPDWQDSVVSAYLMNSSVAPPPDKFNNSLQRGYPDVAAVGDRILIIEDQSVTVEAGTSASTPIFAGLVSLLNDWRISNGKTPLGFLNPLLYQMAAAQPDAFNDITEGNNRCTAGICCTYGFEAGPGWDAVSGLGTPNFSNMLDYIKTLNN